MKRGILILIFLVLITTAVYAKDYISLKLDRETLAENQKFEGYVEFQVGYPISIDSILVFKINEDQIQKKISDHINVLDYDLFPATYNKISGSSQSSKDIIFNGAESKLEVGIDMTAGDESTALADIGEILGFSFNIAGSTKSGSYPSVGIDVGNNNINDYVYSGNKIGEEEEDSSYLGDFIPDAGKQIRADAQDIFCQKVILHPSKSYNFIVKLDRLSSGANMYATILEDPADSFVCGNNIELGEVPCCVLKGFTDLSCADPGINKEITETGTYYACVSIQEDTGNYEKTYYEIKTDNDNKIKQGYYNGELTQDYFIKVKRGLYEDKLSGIESKIFDVKLLQDYLSECGLDKCLVVPLNVTSKYKGKTTLSNLNLRFESLGITSLNKFVNIEYQPERVNYTKKVKIDLADFENLIVPLEGEDYKISVGLLDLKSDDIKFNSVEGPTAIIKTNTLSPAVGLPVNFDASYSRAKDNRTIEKYEWTIGDEKKEGKKLTHTFLKEGEVEITLTVIDNEGGVGKDKIKINVLPLNENIDELITYSLNLIKDAENKLETENTQLKDTLGLLEIDLGKIETNILTLNTSIKKIIGSKTKTEEQKNEELAKALTQLNNHINEIPKDFSVSVSTFSSKIFNIEDIPLKIASTDSKKEAIFRAQEDVVVSSEARVISIIYQNRQEDFILIKKIIEKGTGDVYEVLPQGLETKEILTEGKVILADNLIKFPSAKEFIYLAEGELFLALQTKTIVVPSDLDIEEGVIKKPPEQEITVGSNLPRILLIIGALVFIVLIVYFGMFFHGGLFNKRPTKDLFKNQRNYYTLRTYVQRSLGRGVKEKQIKTTLKNKGWKKDQIEAVLKEFKK